MILLQAPSSGISSLIMFGMIFIVMYFFMIRPQIKKHKKEREYRLSLKKGDKVVTIGGIHGTVAGFKGKESNLVILKLDKSNNLTINRSAISSLSKNDDQSQTEDLQQEA